jgi:hypothetical protein
MKKYTSIGLSMLTLAGVAVAMLLWTAAFRAALYNYHSPLRESELPAVASSSTPAASVVIVLVGGLGYDASETLNLPALAQLRRIGANAAALSVPPTYAQTAWATLLSGAPPEMNTAPPLDAPVDDLRLLGVDTIFARAHEAGLRTAVLGPAVWRRLIPRNQLDDTFFVDAPGSEADRAILEAAFSRLKDDQAHLILIHLTQLDVAAQQPGDASGQAYKQAAGQVDAYLDKLSAVLDLKRTVLVVVSDHGYTAAGGYGGSEEEVIWQPLVMVGGNTTPGNYSNVNQADLAPTLAAILGVAPPSAAQGRILFEMLRLSDADRVFAQVRLAQQRVQLAQAYLAAVQGENAALPERVLTDLTQAQVVLTSNPAGAFQLAELAQREADTQMVAARHSRSRAEQIPRLIFIALTALIWASLLWQRRGFHAGSILIAAAITLALYHGLYQLQGYSYSVSSLSEQDLPALPFDFARRVAVSLLAGGGLMLFFFMLTDEVDWVTLLGSMYGFSVLVVLMFILSFFWGYWQNGLVPTWRLPDVGAVFWQVSGAFEALSAAVLGFILPWPVMSLSLSINLLRRRLSQRQTRPAKPDALPGLRP